MANYERGVYEPSDEVRVFDGSEEEEDIEGSRLPLLIVLALLVLAMFGGVVWLAYTQGVARGRGETPILTAAAGPERVAPPQGSAADTVPYQGFKIYEQPAPPDDTSDNAPTANNPATQQTAPATQTPNKQVAQQPSPAPAAKPAHSSPEAMAPSGAPTTPPKSIPAPHMAVPAPGPAPKAAQSTPPKSVAALIQQANATSTAQPAKSASVAKQTVSQVGGQATAGPRQLGGAAVSATIQQAPQPSLAAKAPVSGGYVLQIGAYKSQADADAAWKVYKAKHAALLAAYADDVQQADLGAKGIWYRLRISGFADKNLASSLCDRLKADGGACILSR